MKKIYIFSYSDATGGRDVVKNWLNKEPLVTHWRYDMPHCFYIVSEATANVLSKSFMDFNGKKGRHLIAEITDNRQGLLTPSSWFLMKNKKQAPKEITKSSE
ncbi:TPA: hypothetical protein ACXJQO_005061 [Serratia marcescens]|uniref:hypothetical protein n=1 Tax=Serratia marcescens TaxID=615 RepID=UPI00237F690F|nr:hypothetical protein [Serratia marcescens]